MAEAVGRGCCAVRGQDRLALAANDTGAWYPFDEAMRSFGRARASEPLSRQRSELVERVQPYPERRSRDSCGAETYRLIGAKTFGQRHTDGVASCRYRTGCSRL